MDTIGARCVARAPTLTSMTDKAGWWGCIPSPHRSARSACTYRPRRRATSVAKARVSGSPSKAAGEMVWTHAAASVRNVAGAAGAR